LLWLLQQDKLYWTLWQGAAAKFEGKEEQE
jgi:hypothetical protein